MARERAHGTGSIVKQASGMVVLYWTDANGKRRKKSLRTRNRKEDEARAGELEKVVQAADREEALLHAARARRIVSSRDLPLADVWRDCMGTNPMAGPGTLALYERALNEFIEWLTTERPSIESFTQIDITTAIATSSSSMSSGSSTR